MIRLWGAEQNLATILALSRPYAVEGQTGTEAVRDALLCCLNANQPGVPRPRGPIEFVRAEGKYESLLEIFNMESRLDDTPYRLDTGARDETGAEKLTQMRSALEELGRRDPTTRSIFDLTIFVVFWAPCGIATGGTTSQALGVLWADPRRAWSERDFLEFLIHELSHYLLFLSEWRYGLFSSPEEMTNRANYAASAIRRAVRPLDKAFHSVVVGTEILLAREEVLGHTEATGLHPGSVELRDGVAHSIDSIAEVAERGGVLSPHALQLLDRSREVVEEMSIPSGIAA